MNIMRCKKHLLLALCLSVLIAGNIFGQENEPIEDHSTPLPPTTPQLTPGSEASAANGSIYAPNLFNGSVTVGIPVYQFHNDYGDYGVSLSYSTLGVKVDEMPTSVGLHWNLNAGGYIYRQMKDMPDELNMVASDVYTGGRGKFAQNYENPNDGFTGYKDGEYDDFTVSAGSLSFTFNIGKNGYVFINPERRVKVEMLMDGVPSNVAAVGTTPEITFHITDEQGIQYWFGTGEQAYYDFYSMGHVIGNERLWSRKYTASWVLKEVMFPNGQTVNYTYSTTAYNPNRAISYMSQNLSFAGFSGSYVKTSELGSVYISSIQYPNGVNVSFNYRPHPEKRADAPYMPIIQEIDVSSGSNTMRYKMQQVYSIAPNNTFPGITEWDNLDSTLAIYAPSIIEGNYWIAPDEADRFNHLQHRLVLKGITMQSGDNTVTEPYYTFEYDTTPLPGRTDGRQDFWGYYNGTSGTNNGSYYNGGNHDYSEMQTCIPAHNVNGTFSGRSRDYNFTYAKAGILTKVTNAYGGSTVFEYEANTGVNALTGLPVMDLDFLGMNTPDGIRISKITETDKFYPSNSRQTIYTYGAGRLFLNGGYFKYPDVLYNDGSQRIVWTSIYTSPFQFINGANHGYDNVTVETRDQDGNSLGKKLITFSNFDASAMHLAGQDTKYYELPYASRQYIEDWKIGLPLTTTTYDRYGNIKTVVENTYDTATLDEASSSGTVENTKTLWGLADPPGYQAGDDNPGILFYGSPIASTTYHPYRGMALLAQTITRKYISPTDYMADTVNYYYDERHNLVSTTTTNSKGEQIQLRNVYNYMVGGSEALPDDQPTSATINSMSGSGLEKVVSMERWKLTSSATSDKLLDASITQYQYQDGQLLTKGLYKLQSGSPVLRSDYQGFTNPTSAFGNPYKKNIVAAYNNSAAPAAYYQEASKVTLFTAKGDPLETQLLGQNQYKAMLWDTIGNKIAEAANAKNNEIAFTSFEEDFATGATGSTSSAGNFTWAPGPNVITGAAVTGKKYYKVNGQSAMLLNNLPPNKKYIITFWSKSGVPAVSGPGFSSVSFTNTYSLPSGWKFYTGQCTPNAAGTLAFSSSTVIYLDEVRVFPADAQMQSWTYEPLFGKSSETDARGRITYYEYDKLGRLSVVRDQDGNILSKTDFRIQP